MEKKTLEKEGIRKEEYRYFISSIKEDIELASRAVRGAKRLKCGKNKIG